MTIILKGARRRGPGPGTWALLVFLLSLPLGALLYPDGWGKLQETIASLADETRVLLASERTHSMGVTDSTAVATDSTAGADADASSDQEEYSAAEGALASSSTAEESAALTSTNESDVKSPTSGLSDSASDTDSPSLVVPELTEEQEVRIRGAYGRALRTLRSARTGG